MPHQAEGLPASLLITNTQFSLVTHHTSADDLVIVLNYGLAIPRPASSTKLVSLN